MKWIEVSVRVVPSQVELAGDHLRGLAWQGLWESSDKGGRRRVLRAYVPATSPGRAAIRGLRRALAPAVPGASMRSRTVDDAAWGTAWKARARRIRIGTLIIQPSWMKDSTPGRVVIRLDAGMAFGSGEHPSTR
ncbi:MAG TPA: 50S ribosomal protein L11 methyltransferase, partial [bacterium]|nr:50S ribosomal protein L11 methyltransferase [bacterium]